MAAFGRLLCRNEKIDAARKFVFFFYFCSLTVCPLVHPYLIMFCLYCFWFRLRMMCTTFFELSRRLAAVSKCENCRAVHII